MNRLLTLSVLASLSTVAQAAPETYIIDNSHTYPHFTYNHLGFSFQTHKFDKTSGKVVLDRIAQTGSVDVTIDATSVNTGHAVFNQKIQAADYFDTAVHPTITFKSDRMIFNGSQPVSLEGELMVKGVTRPVTLAITHFNCMLHPMLRTEVCGANASTQIRRSDFNMGKNAPFVSDEVTLSLAIEAVKAQPGQ